ncbi:MAG TPA: hypothetical protein PK165_07600 [bacterium]|nr:hypothetical protein [bacterium]HOL35581.1 hypothetical protein [bacterium]HPO52678.1 hypothetical protein [bacterium]
MELKYKPDFEQARIRWRHFWNKELYKRPILMAGCYKKGVRKQFHDVFSLRYYRAYNGLWQQQIDLFNEWAECFDFLGDGVPSLSPDFGPDQFAAFYGANLRFSEQSKHTSWAEPIIDDWDKFLPLKFNPLNETFQKLLAYTRFIAEDARGKYLVSDIDRHSNIDALLALRGAEKLCMDLYDRPEIIEKAMLKLRKDFPLISDMLYKAGIDNSGLGTTVSWTSGFYSEKKFSVVQADFICMMSPEMFRKFVLPALEEEIEYYDYSYFHLDGPGALKHLDDILSIRKLSVLQWQPGDGQKPNFQWLDILKKAQKAGKAVHVFGNSMQPLTAEIVKKLHKELEPALVVYDGICIENRKEFENLSSWLEKN